MVVADSSRATAPETCRVAIEVPLKAAHWPPGTDDTTATPGALTSGFEYGSGSCSGGMKATAG